MRKNIFFALIIAIAFFAGGLVRFTDFSLEQNSSYFEKSHNLFFEYDSVSYSTSVDIGDSADEITIGFDTGTHNIDFGIALAGSSTNRRFVTLSNSNEKKARVFIEKSGNISEFVSFSYDSFVLMPGQEKNITIELYGSGMQTGSYSGSIIFTFKRAKFGFLGAFL